MEKALRLAMFISLLAFAQWRVSLAWIPSTATFYGGADASETMGGACGYGNLYTAGYGVMTTALSTALFNNGGSCGACYQIKCDPSKSSLCKLGTSVTVTATNLCPPNYAYTIKNGGWCNPPNQHFDMAQPAWEIIGVYRAGIIPVFYQRVPCKRSGGIRFAINGNPYFELVTISNVGGSGIVVAVWIKGSKTDWLLMSRNWGMNWQCGGYLNGQILSFRIQLDNGKILIFYNIAPTNWWFGSTYSTLLNF